MLLKVPLLNIQIFKISGYVNTICMFYIQIYIYKLYQLYVEMQAHTWFHYPLWCDNRNTLALVIMLKCLFTNIEKFVSSHYTIPPTTFVSIMRAQASLVVHIFQKIVPIWIYCIKSSVRAESTVFIIEKAYRF